MGAHLNDLLIIHNARYTTTTGNEKNPIQWAGDSFEVKEIRLVFKNSVSILTPACLVSH